MSPAPEPVVRDAVAEDRAAKENAARLEVAQGAPLIRDEHDLELRPGHIETEARAANAARRESAWPIIGSYAADAEVSESGMTESLPMPWLDPEWRADAESWMREHAVLTRPPEQLHLQPWSTVMRLETTDGVLWFKATRSDLHGFEPRLTEILAATRADRVTELVAIDAARGWMLMRDAGTRLRELAEPFDPRRWEEILPRYADLQIALTPKADELLALGVPDERPAGIPDRIEALLDDERALMLDESDELTAERRDELRRRLPELRALTTELESFGVPSTLQHDDFHDGQVYVEDGRYRFLDWGDSCISHPFHTLTVTLRVLAWRHGLEPGSAALLRLRDAYLEPFGAPAIAADIAYRTGTLARALAWYRYVRALTPEEIDPDDAESVPYGLRLYLVNGPIGTWK